MRKKEKKVSFSFEKIKRKKARPRPLENKKNLLLLSSHPYPRPWIENTSSTGIENGLSSARSGVGTYESTASISFKIASLPIASFSPFRAASADPRTIGMSSPLNW